MSYRKHLLLLNDKELKFIKNWYNGTKVDHTAEEVDFFNEMVNTSDEDLNEVRNLIIILNGMSGKPYTDTKHALYQVLANKLAINPSALKSSYPKN